MTSMPETPTHKDSVRDHEDSKLEDHSDDDTDHQHDETAAHREGKSHDAEATYTEEVNTNYSLFSNPPDLAAMRRQLFELRDEIEMSARDFEDYFPFVDNVWRKYRSAEPQHEAEGTTETFCCRLKPSGQSKTATPKPYIEGKQQRRKRKREDRSCSMLMKVTYVQSPVKKVKIVRAVGSDPEHSHDLDYMDQNKRNSAVMDVARREATRGFLPGSIYWKMQEEPAKMEEAGGKFMKVSDVRNVQYPWRQQNMSAVLKAHSGYSQQRSGPRQRLVNSNPSTPQHGTARPTKPVQTYSAPHSHPPPQLPPPQQPVQSASVPPQLPPGTLNYPDHARDFLRPYLPYAPQLGNLGRPHVTLTWAQSLDGRIALQPGKQTAISGPETKAMTHFLRSQHDAILIGVNTAIADDPGLNCRLAGAGGYGGPNRAMQPRPVIIDPRARLEINPNMRLLRAAADGQAQGPWIVVGPGVKLSPDAVATLKRFGGEYLQINEIHHTGLDWHALFGILHREGIRSIMIEGGGKVLSELLKPRYTPEIDSVVITIAPTFFGMNGVQVAPDTTYEGHNAIQSRLVDAKWQPMGQSDVVLCGRLNKNLPPRLPGIEHISRQPPPPAQPQTNHPPPPGSSHSILPPIHPPHQPSQAPPPPGPPTHINGHSATTTQPRSPQFRHYGPPGPSRAT